MPISSPLISGTSEITQSMTSRSGLLANGSVTRPILSFRSTMAFMMFGAFQKKGIIVAGGCQARLFCDDERAIAVMQGGRLHAPLTCARSLVVPVGNPMRLAADGESDDALGR